MKRIFLLCCFVILNTSLVFSEGEDKTAVKLEVDQQALDSFTKKNPFKSQLPEKIIKEDATTQITENPNPQIPVQQEAPPAPPPTPPQLTISGIVWNTNKPQAIVNGQVVNQGDTIGGAQIVSIKKSGIDVIFQEVNFTIKP